MWGSLVLLFKFYQHQTVQEKPGMCRFGFKSKADGLPGLVHLYFPQIKLFNPFSYC